ncbi:hypothetical protein VNO80_07210 [Phaseolus coccineus]|uniref:Uncharacterized protein n=1 Tax=Phaseolus coccineus TaxID=3886 RepID=A0AAN9RF64_PHACN
MLKVETVYSVITQLNIVIAREIIFNDKTLINNAGTASTKSLLDYTGEDVTTLMGTNFESCFNLCQLAHPLLKASGYGNIVFISSVAGLKAFPICSAYAASKGALNQFTKNIALEWAKDNIRANAVAPGAVKTDLLDSLMECADVNKNVVEAVVSGSPIGRIGEPKDISGVVAFLCLKAPYFKCCYISDKLFF